MRWLTERNTENDLVTRVTININGDLNLVNDLVKYTAIPKGVIL